MTDQRPTDAFRAEHREVQEHLRHVHEWVGALSAQQPAEQRTTAQNVVSFFEQHITPHAEWEERFLYPVVDKLAGSRGSNSSVSWVREQALTRAKEPVHVRTRRPLPSSYTRNR
jgi:hemerythrin-like domain-containing protein